MSEPLWLEAEVVDRFSRPLRNLRDALGGIGAPKNARQIQREFDQLGRAVRQASSSIRDGLGAALSGLGIAGISAASGIAAVTQSVRAFSLGMGELRALSRETGLSVRTMRVLEGAATRFQIAPEKVRGGLKTFSENLYDFRRQFGATYAEVLKIAPDLAKSLKEASPDKAVDVALDYLSWIENRTTAGRVSSLLFGSDDFARFGQEGAGKLKEIFADTLRRIGDVSPEDAAKAEAFEQASARIKNSFEGLQRSMTIAAAPVLTQFADWLERVIRNGQGEIGKAIETQLRMIGQGARAFNDAVEGSIGWEWLIKGLLAVKVAQTAAGFVQLGGGFMTLGRAVGLADLGKLSAVFKVLAGFGAGYGAYKLGEAKGAASSGGSTGPAGSGARHAGTGREVSPGSSRKVDERTGRALRDGVAEGVEKGLTAAARAAELGGGAGVGGAALFDAVRRGRASGWGTRGADLGDAARRGRHFPPGVFRPGATGKWWTPERQKFAIDYLRKHAGLSEVGAAALVARWAGVEAAAGPGARNPYSGAEGIAQWLGRRKRPGVTDIPNFEGQLAHAAHELNTTERRAGDALRKAQTPWEGARGASMYERAEGYSARTGIDNFTGRTPAERVLQEYRNSEKLGAAQRAVEASKEQAAAPGAEVPAPGQAADRARKAGAVGGADQRLPLFVRLHGAPRSVRIATDGGDAFSNVEVERSRTSQAR